MSKINNQQLHFRDYLRILVKHRWIAIFLFLFIVVSVAVYDFSSTPIYEASTQLIIEKENPKVVSIQEVMAVDASGTDYYQTQYKIIESRSVAREVIRRLGLDRSEEFFPKSTDDFFSELKRSVKQNITSWKDALVSLLKTEQNAKQSEEAASDSVLVSVFIKRIQVIPIRNSRIVDITFAAKDPKLAAQIVNAIAQAYIDHNLETRVQAIRSAMSWLNNRIEDERKKVERTEQALLKYKELHGIITDFSSDVETITAQKLAQLNAQVVEAESKRVESETKYKQALVLNSNPMVSDSIPDVLANSHIQDIKKSEVEIYKTISELGKKYGSNHPKMQAAQSELAILQTRKKAEVQRVIQSIKNEFEVAQAREKSLKTSLTHQKQEVLDLNQKAIEYGVLRRECESAKAMYEVLIKRFKETSITEDINTSNIRIIDRAEVPTPAIPTKPKTGRDLLLALILGALLASSLAFFLEYLDNTVKTPEDITNYLELPYLGLVPSIKFDTSAKGAKGPPSPDLISRHEPSSAASEAFRGIRTKILFSTAEEPPKVIAVTSVAPGEGKTISSANLALVMAQTGSKVVLIDCDMRRPKLHKLFGVNRDRGISNVLVGESELDSVIVNTGISGLCLIPCGPIPPNPSELLGSAHMKKVLDTLRKHFDHILIDTPPISAVADVILLTRSVDGILFVVRANGPARDLIRNGLNQLSAVSARILGAILNDVNLNRNAYYYKYYHSYSYYNDKDRSNSERRSA